jgi:hypothetical protein
MSSCAKPSTAARARLLRRCHQRQPQAQPGLKRKHGRPWWRAYGDLVGSTALLAIEALSVLGGAIGTSATQLATASAFRTTTVVVPLLLGYEALALATLILSMTCA